MIQYEVIRRIPSPKLIKSFIEIETKCFDKSIHSEESFKYEFDTKNNFISILAKEGSNYVAMKVGYERKPGQFYSWLGGVDPSYRGKGIARELMNIQHRILKEEGYKSVRTNTGNEFKSMLVLNLKMGFDITGMYLNSRNQLRISLEKML